MDMGEIVAEPGFWILGGGAIVATILGWIWSIRAGMTAFGIGELIVIMLVELVAAAFFVGRE